MYQKSQGGLVYPPKIHSSNNAMTSIFPPLITPSINGMTRPNLGINDVIVEEAALDWPVTQGSSLGESRPPPLCPSMARGNDSRQQWRKAERRSTVSRCFIGAQFHSAPPSAPSNTSSEVLARLRFSLPTLLQRSIRTHTTSIFCII